MPAQDVPEGRVSLNDVEDVLELLVGLVMWMVSMAAAKWAIGAREWSDPGMVAVGCAGRVGDRIRGCEPTGVLAVTGAGLGPTSLRP